MKIDVLTIYPGMFPGPLDESIVKRAQESGKLKLGFNWVKYHKNPIKLMFF
jgi:tRNA G37 N-methylase TrmD